MSRRQDNQQSVTKWRRCLDNCGTNFHEDDRAGRPQHIKDGSNGSAGGGTEKEEEKNGNLSCLSERIVRGCKRKKQDLYCEGFFFFKFLPAGTNASLCSGIVLRNTEISV
jgi:hypothetical protein